MGRADYFVRSLLKYLNLMTREVFFSRVPLLKEVV